MFWGPWKRQEDTCSPSEAGGSCANGLKYAATDCSGENSDLNQVKNAELKAGAKTTHRVYDIQGLDFLKYLSGDARY